MWVAAALLVYAVVVTMLAGIWYRERCEYKELWLRKAREEFEWR